MHKRLKTLTCLFCIHMAAAVMVMVILSAPASAASKFREDFAKSYRNNQFNYMSILIRENITRVPGEVRALIKEATASDKTYAEKMELLDLANTMATMHLHWNKDDGPLKEVEPVLKETVRKEEARKAEAAKWAAFELYPGNVLLRTQKTGLKKAGVDPVVYPHWVHRLYYDCRACHDSRFSIQRTAAGMTHAEMKKGRQCGECHDGKTAFSTEKSCKKCHNTTGTAKKELVSPDGLDLKKAADTAKRLGSRLDVRGQKLPYDRFGFIDWVALKKSGGYSPIGSVKNPVKGKKPEVRDDVVIFKSPSDFMADVPFSHRTHTDGIECSTCHPSVFKDKLGAVKSNMTEMAEGSSCGACHNKTAFKLADCMKCHKADADWIKAQGKARMINRP